MSGSAKRSLEILALVLAVAAAVAGVAQTYFVVPVRIQKLEEEQNRIRVTREADHDLLQRIDERTARIDKALDKLGK